MNTITQASNKAGLVKRLLIIDDMNIRELIKSNLLDRYANLKIEIPAIIPDVIAELENNHFDGILMDVVFDDWLTPSFQDSFLFEGHVIRDGIDFINILSEHKRFKKTQFCVYTMNTKDIDALKNRLGKNIERVLFFLKEEMFQDSFEKVLDGLDEFILNFSFQDIIIDSKFHTSLKDIDNGKKSILSFLADNVLVDRKNRTSRLQIYNNDFFLTQKRVFQYNKEDVDSEELVIRTYNFSSNQFINLIEIYNNGNISKQIDFKSLISEWNIDSSLMYSDSKFIQILLKKILAFNIVKLLSSKKEYSNELDKIQALIGSTKIHFEFLCQFLVYITSTLNDDLELLKTLESWSNRLHYPKIYDIFEGEVLKIENSESGNQMKIHVRLKSLLFKKAEPKNRKFDPDHFKVNGVGFEGDYFRLITYRNSDGVVCNQIEPYNKYPIIHDNYKNS